MIAMILGMIALGLVVFTAVALTCAWILKKVKEKKLLQNVKRVMIADIQRLVNSSDNTITLDQLDALANKGVTHVMVDIDASGDIAGEIEAIKDTNRQLDDEVDKLLGRERMVVMTI